MRSNVCILSIDIVQLPALSDLTLQSLTTLFSARLHTFIMPVLISILDRNPIPLLECLSYLGHEHSLMYPLYVKQLLERLIIYLIWLND